jgi:hypothetical protein
MAFNKAFRGRDDTALTDWNQVMEYVKLIAWYHQNIGDAQLEMWVDRNYAKIMVTRMQSLWGFIRPILIQKHVEQERLKSIDERFPKAQLLAELWGTKPYSSPESMYDIFNKLNGFYNEIRLVTQLTGFGVPVKRSPLTDKERVASLRAEVGVSKDSEVDKDGSESEG